MRFDGMEGVRRQSGGQGFDLKDTYCLSGMCWVYAQRPDFVAADGNEVLRPLVNAPASLDSFAWFRASYAFLKGKKALRCLGGMLKESA